VQFAALRMPSMAMPTGEGVNACGAADLR